jgi:outer membrane protein assembly factor BamD
MKKNKIIFIIIICFVIIACSKEQKKVLAIKEVNQSQELISSYSEAMEALNRQDYYFSAQKFLDSEILFPQSEWAPKSVLMASYSYYMQDYYSLAIENIKRYFETYPNDKNQAYAHYLLAICYFELIEGEKKDTAALYLAKKEFELVISRYPDTDYAYDSKFKVNLLKDLLAAKEIYLGRYYMKKEKWIPALNRFKFVMEKYETTEYVKEAIHRMVEINYKLGLIDESKKYAALLGYNYQSSEWYKETYKIFNKDYKLPRVSKKKNKTVQKIKNFFN